MTDDVNWMTVIDEQRLWLGRNKLLFGLASYNTRKQTFDGEP